MRHRVKNKALRRNSTHRGHMVRNLLTSLFLEGKVKTTDARAKVLAAEVDRVFSKLQNTNEEMNQIRFLQSILYGEAAQRKVIEEYLGAYKDRNSGFTRQTRVGIRKGDAATLIQVELI